MVTILHLRSVVKEYEGQWYKKTLEYGFHRQLDTQVYVDTRKVAEKFHNLETQERVEKDMYACGFIGPNYPVPAILTHVEYSLISQAWFIWKRATRYWIITWEYPK